jgi:hypothetical protein
MSNARILWLFVSIILISMPALAIVYNRVIQVTFGINGTCSIGNMTEPRNHTMNLNKMSGGYFENLTTDNPQLAELVCQNNLNFSAAK